MWQLLTAPQNAWFTAAFLLMILLAIAELAGLLLGGSASGYLENLLPDGFDGDAHLGGGWFTAWLDLGKVPLLVSLGLFLLVFSIVGFTLQSVVGSVGLGFLPALVAAPAAFVGSLPTWKVANRLVARVWPKDETSAVSTDSFIGRLATVTIGKATFDRPAEARLQDATGRTHYIMVASDLKGVSHPQGETVLVVGRRGSVFTVIENPNPNLG